jgi:hypothetical protein
MESGDLREEISTVAVGSRLLAISRREKKRTSASSTEGLRKIKVSCQSFDIVHIRI